jgi:hypothetical protein
MLSNGPRQARDVEDDARDAGYSMATMRRAKAAIGVVSRKPDFGGHWEWTLPVQDAQPPKMLTQGAHALGTERLRKNKGNSAEIRPRCSPGRE